MKHKLFRIAVALILVVVLIVSWSPIRVQASALPEAAGVVTKVIPFAKVVEPAALGVGGTAFCWVAAGLGIIFTAAQAVKAYNDYQDFTGELEMSIYYYPDGSWSYGVDMGFVERVRAFLWDAGVLAPGVYIDPAFTDISASALAIAQKFPHYFIATKDDGVFCIGWANCGFIMGSNNYGKYVVPESMTAGHQRWDSDTGLIYNASNTYVTSITFYESGVNDLYHSAPDVNLGIVALPDLDISTGYPEWHTNARPSTNPDTQEEITVLPIPFNPSVDPETQIGTLTQPDIWQGTIADPMPDTDPDTGTDVPSADIADYSIDLTSFFPFCLPFDIYAFFELLAAEPETPHLEFDIELPFMQEPWHVVIDLSAWDSTALLARRLELLAFIIGLCVFTREKFLRS